MHILHLLWAGSARPFWGALFTAALAGLANVTLIALINQAAEQAAKSQPIGSQSVFLYLAVFAFFYVADRAALNAANRYVQRRLGDLRFRLVSRIRNAELRRIETLGHGELYATVAQEINHLTQSFPLLVSAAQGLFMLLFGLLYIASLSLVSFLAVGGFMLAGLCLFWFRRQALSAAMMVAHEREAAVLDSIAHFTDGFQELRLNANKNDALFQRFTMVAGALETTVVGLGRLWVMMLQFTNAFQYALVGMVVFVLPLFFQGYTDVIYKIVAVAIFSVGPVAALTAVAPIFAKADVGLGLVYRLERQLAQGETARSPAEADRPSAFAGFSTIRFERMVFSYRDAEGVPNFTSGPWNFTLQRGEIVFFTGGNGSGKSTVMKLICGLYAPDAGDLLVDGVAVTSATRQHYRELFAAIFPDFHLFGRLHGLENADPIRVQQLIERMELADKVAFSAGRFSNQALSTGQRKRLAMIVALLEDREIYLFDEWAADQDAHFRDVFYTELLPDLRRRGKTVLAVTHDDRYWHCCDRRLQFDLGRIVPTEPR